MDDVSENEGNGLSQPVPEAVEPDAIQQGSDPVSSPEPAPDGASGGSMTEASSAEPLAAEVADGAPSAPPKGGPSKKKWRRDPGLALSFRKGLPVDGTVEQVIRGGYEVRVGKARGFCPHSQMDLQHVDNPDQHVGRTYPFKVLQIRRGGEEVVLSRRSLLEEMRSDEAKAVRATLIEGHLIQGHVARTTDFGAFVDLGAGVTGLVHVSEISHARVAHASEALAAGDLVQVKILKLDEDSGRISLSIRQALDDPWRNASERYQIGATYPGVLRRLADFGAFVELAPGIEALAPADGFPPSAGGWSEGLRPGEESSWRLVALDAKRKRMSVVPAVGGETSMEVPIQAGSKLKGRVQRVEKFGVFVWLRPGQVGLIPNVYTGTRRGTDLTSSFPVGREIDVEVIETDPDGRRIRLSVPGAAERVAPTSRPAGPPLQRPRERARPRDEAVPEQPPTQTFGTSLGDALRQAIRKKDGGAAS